MPFLSHNQQHQSTEGVMDSIFYRQQNAWSAAQPCQEEAVT